MTTDNTRCRLHHGDFAETLALCEGQADLVFTSPPYADARTYGMGCSWDVVEYHRLGLSVFAALRPGGHALVCLDAPVREWRKGYGTERGFLPWEVMLDWAHIGFRVPDRLAFGRMGGPGAYTGRFRNDWEPLFWFQRPGGESYFDKHVLAGRARYGSASAGLTSSTKPDGTKSRRRVSGWAVEEGTIHRGTFWDYGHQGHGHTGAADLEKQGHPARWPLKLAEDLVRCFCPPDGLCCDPFLGAGTSAVAALEHGRRFVGGDIGSRQDTEDNRARGLDPVPWVDVASRVLARRHIGEAPRQWWL